VRSERPRGPLRPPRAKAAPKVNVVHAVGEAAPKRAPRGARGSSGGAPMPDSQKLQKILAQAGLGSRRAMELWIEAGRVKVNGKAVGIGTRVMPADRIAVDGRDLRLAHAAEAPRVLIYHKPEGEIVTRDDPQGRETVFAHLPRLRGARWLSIGRLDVSTSGLLLFTTSGALANSMMHPRFAVEREYAARVFGKLSDEQMAQLLAGVELDDGIARCDKLEDEGGEGANHWYRLVMSEGRNRVVRRLFEAVGFTVSRLIRVRFGPMQLPPRLKRGQLEELPPADVRRLSEWLAQPVPGAKPARPERRLRGPGPRASA
jgi:23S rRNA pseudouridine2605 synthase